MGSGNMTDKLCDEIPGLLGERASIRDFPFVSGPRLDMAATHGIGALERRWSLTEQIDSLLECIAGLTVQFDMLSPAKECLASAERD
jgi:hypothetical protein